MFEVVRDIVNYIENGISGPTLQEAEKQFGRQDLRIFCIMLNSWWGREFLMTSRYPEMSMWPPHPWHETFRQFVGSIKELNDLIYFTEDDCRFVESLSRKQWKEINDYVKANCSSEPIP